MMHDDLGRRHGVLDREARLDAGTLGHPDVEQHHVRSRTRGERRALDAVTRLTDHLDARLDRQQHRQAPPEKLLVIDHDHPDGLAFALRRQLRHGPIMARAGPRWCATGWSDHPEG
jgi:hypothetical protein